MTLSIQNLPSEIFIWGIFSFLSPRDLAKVKTVCKEWRTFADETERQNSAALKKRYPNVVIFDRQDWNKYFGLVVNGMPLDDAMMTHFLEQSSRFSKADENTATLSGTVCFMPYEMTIKKLAELALSPIEGNPINWILERCDSNIAESVVTKPISQAHWVFITNFIVKETVNKSYDETREVLKQSGHEMPNLITLFTCFVAHNSILKKIDLFHNSSVHCHMSDTGEVVTFLFAKKIEAKIQYVDLFNINSDGCIINCAPSGRNVCTAAMQKIVA